MSKPNFAEADTLRKGLATVAQQDGASSGHVVSVNDNGELEMVAQGSSGGGSGTVTSVAATDASIVVGGTPTVAPTLATGTLDVIAVQHPPAASWSNNSKKITGLANGSGAQDAAAFGQIPTSLPPSGGAGGDLAGSYPNPTLAAVGGAAGPIGSSSVVPVVTIDAKGRVVALGSVSPTVATLAAPAGDWSNNSHKITGLANGASAQDAAAFGQIPIALPPNGSAGGDLTGSYPNPTLAAAGGGAAGPIGSTSVVPVVTVDAKGRVTALTSVSPTVATLSPPAGDWSNNSKKITSLANGSAAQDAAAFGQIPITFTDPLARALGLVSWNFFPATGAQSASALTSQTIYVAAVPYVAGQIVTNIGFVVVAAGTSTAPTAIFCGICNATTMLKQTGNVASDSAWTSTGLRHVALTGSYTIPTTGLYYHVILENGAFAGVAMTLNRGASGGGTNITPGGVFITATAGTGQTALPADNASMAAFASSGFLNLMTFSD